MVSNDDKMMGMVTHLLGIVIGFLGPLIMYLVKKDRRFVLDNARNALNFQLTMLIAWVAAYVLVFVLIGALLLPLLFIFNVVMSVIGGVKAHEGNVYEYPIAIPFIK